jgi:hypothetical protein
MRPFVFILTALILSWSSDSVRADEARSLRENAIAAMKQAAGFYHKHAAAHGGYVYFYSLDLKQRWGEGVATKDQVWVQPPGTPTVGLAYLQAYQATGDQFFLDAATDAALSLIHGQLKSGGWTNCVDFNPRGSRSAHYRNGKGRGKNNFSLDDGQTQSAIRLMIHADEAHGFKHAAIHESAEVALDALLKAQFPNGAFPQVWTGPVEKQPVLKASYPEYDWRTEGRIKNYWDMYTLNDNVCGFVADTLSDAHRIYEDERYLRALRKLGDFLILAQMPEPQPAWAQQYNGEMQPIWARKFEPPGIAGDESQEVITTLMKISAVTGDRKYLEPVPRAMAYLKRSLLPDGRLARYYELKTNTPLYMSRRGKVYTLTYDDSNLPDHYGWKWKSRLDDLDSEYELLRNGGATTVSIVKDDDIRRILSALDDRGRWVKTYAGERLIGQAKMPRGAKYLSSELFSHNLSRLSEFVHSKPSARD